MAHVITITSLRVENFTGKITFGHKVIEKYLHSDKYICKLMNYLLKYLDWTQKRNYAPLTKIVGKIMSLFLRKRLFTDSMQKKYIIREINFEKSCSSIHFVGK